MTYGNLLLKQIVKELVLPKRSFKQPSLKERNLIMALKMEQITWEQFFDMWKKLP